MSSENEQLQPTPFDVAQPTPADPASTETTTRQGTAPWVVPALGGLLLLALVVVFWLPERVSSPDPAGAEPQQTAAGGDSPAPAAATPAAPASPPVTADASPWSEAQMAKLRKEAQEVLAELLDLQFALEERGVKDWAQERFEAAAAIATAGDELYKTRQYEPAKARYEEGLLAFQALQDAIPVELAAQLELARQAIEDGEVEQAESALQMASLIEPDSSELATLRQRTQVLPQLLPMLEQAATAEHSGDLASAEKVLTEATAVDPLHLRTRAELQRVIAAHQEQRFNDAMSDGYTALDDGRFDQARTAFRAAAKLQPGSNEAASALLEVETAETAYRLATLKQRGSNFEQGEKWQDAVDAYEKAQGIDSNVLYAQEGLQRSRGRARLDKQFRSAIDDPGRLSDAAVADATAQLLQQAGKITPRGPVLDKQIRQLQQLLQQANTPVAVTLRSDQETEVTVYKVARLGRFQQKELTLRPGTYTAVGIRNGYRDVRRDFTVTHNGAPPAVNITCTEPI